MEIPRIQPYGPGLIDPRESLPKTSGLAQSAGKTFDQVLNSLSESEGNANSLMQQLAMGEDVDVHNVMISAEENDVNFRVTLAIRDKLVDAYREIMRMAI